MTSPLSPASRNSGSFTFNRTDTPKTTYKEPWIEPQRPMPTATTSHHQLKIKPYLRKLSSKEHSNGLDLSRPAAENEGLAGLGIAEYGAGGYSRSISDVTFTPVNGRHRHTRSASNTSQFSTSSGGLQRPTPLPPIRQTPQSYVSMNPLSPPEPSILNASEKEADDIMSDEEFRSRQNAYESRRSGSLSSHPGSSLRIHTNNSSTRLAASYSQSSVSLSSPSILPPARARGDTLKSIDTTTSPSSRTSFDHATRFIRGGRDSPIDAQSRAASIRAAREKFEAEQRIKELKYEKEASKAAERELRKLSSKPPQPSHKKSSSGSQDRTMAEVTDEKPPRPSVGGRQYSDHRQAHSNSLPKYVKSTVDVEKAAGAGPVVTKRREAKGRWLRFVTWFKTRLLRMTGG
jgi:hypothetical protein